jgi:hypothetical protein
MAEADTMVSVLAVGGRLSMYRVIVSFRVRPPEVPISGDHRLGL